MTETVTVFVGFDSVMATIETTVSVVAGRVVGGSVTVLVTSELCIIVRISVLVTGPAEEPPSTGTTEYCTALL